MRASSASGIGSVGLLELEVAAEQDAGVALERRLHALVEDADRGDDRRRPG